MHFNSKEHMAQELLAGKRFKTTNGSVIYFDPKQSASPFRYDYDAMSAAWDSYGNDIWEEVKPSVHQDLIDSYQPGQAWQYRLEDEDSFIDCKVDDEWVEPEWKETTSYRLHPHNTLIQEHNKGAKIQYYSEGNWVNVWKPNWLENIQYRIKPITVHEWMFKAIGSTKWMIEVLLMSEEEAKSYFKDVEYRQTGRSWEE
jgi:hypothetical protein